MKNLSILQQIEVLEQAKKWMKFYMTISKDSICFSIVNVLNKNYKIKANIREISHHIPSFTFENITLLAQKYKFKKPSSSSKYSGYWWECNSNFDLKNRNCCFNALIKELKKLDSNK